jgi:predicted amidohydrolase YtcJ
MERYRQAMRPKTITALVVAGVLFAGSLPAGAEPADLILRNADIYTVDVSNPHASAFAVAGEHFLAVGSDADMSAFKGPKTRELDLHGAFVLPGFVDSHTHIHEGGEYVTGVQLRDARTLAEVQKRVAAYEKAHPEKKWIIGEAWSYGYPDMPKGEPTKDMLDAVVTDRPVILGSGMAHAGWVNSKAFEVLNITAATPNPKGGEFVRDSKGNPTGWLKESAWEAVRSRAPAETDADRREFMRNAMEEAARVGVTRLVSCGGDWDYLPILAEWERQGKLLTRFSISQWANVDGMNDEYYRSIAEGHERYQSDWVRADAVKFIADGVIESHTAYMPDGYTDMPKEKGDDFWNADVQRQAVVKLNSMGIQVYTHAIGDGAIRQTLDAYEASVKELGERDLRNRIEHYESPYPADIDRLVRLRVIASMQPAMIYPKDQWMGMEGLWQKYAGDKRMLVAFPIHSVLSKGGTVAFGTDWPIVDLNPILGIRNAVVRQSYDGEPPDGWVPAEKITMQQAIAGYTAASAFAAHREKLEGTIQTGKLADFVVLSANLLKAPVSSLQRVKVVRTFVGGKQVFPARSTGKPFVEALPPPAS